MGETKTCTTIASLEQVIRSAKLTRLHSPMCHLSHTMVVRVTLSIH